MLLTIVSGLLLSVLTTVLAQTPVYRRFEYKHSFRAPNLSQRDGSIPFWMVTGDAIASSEQLRLAPSMRSRKGIAWNKRAFVESENFEIEMAFKVTGQGRVGADGLALWYTAQQGTLGPVFGSNDYWTGLGVMFDSFDNDNMKNNPYVSVMINDGTRSYDHQTDGTQQILTGCQKDFRNKPFPVHIKVEYSKNILTVSMTDGLTAQHRFELCMRAENIFLPRNGYFGISAATGALADDHDVVEFSIYSLLSEAPKPAQPIPQDERQKYDAEFQKQMEEYEQERKKFKELHPDKAKSDDEEEEYAKYFEDAAARELRLIYETQNAIHRVMQQMEAKLNQIQQSQNVHTSILQQGGVAPAASSGGQQPPVQAGAPGAGFQQHEKNEVIQGVRDLTASVRDMKNYVNEIFTRTYNLEQKLGGTGADPNKQALENIQNDIRQVRAAQIAQGNAPGISGEILKACCNGNENCAEYKQPEEMFGVACCGLNPMNEFDQICCENVTRSRRQGSTYIDRCCGNQTLSFDQTCCQGIVHNIPNGECCGSQAFSRSNPNILCCNGVLNLNVPKGSLCCGNQPYDGGIRESCCGGIIQQKEQFDGCCSSFDEDEKQFFPYNTKLSLCCDRPIEKTGNFKCCYLRRNGTFSPQSYDYTTSCCAYPYINITAKTNGTCVPTPTLLSANIRQ